MSCGENGLKCDISLCNSLKAYLNGQFRENFLKACERSPDPEKLTSFEDVTVVNDKFCISFLGGTVKVRFYLTSISKNSINSVETLYVLMNYKYIVSNVSCIEKTFSNKNDEFQAVIAINDCCPCPAQPPHGGGAKKAATKIFMKKTPSKMHIVYVDESNNNARYIKKNKQKVYLSDIKGQYRIVR